MRRPLISIRLTILPALFLNAHAGPPPQGGSCTAALNPSVAAGACPAGFTCGSAVTGSGFSQRSITDAPGGVYLQTIVTDSSAGAAASAPAGNAAAAPLSAPGSAHGPYAYLLDAGGNAVITVDLTGLSTLPIAATTAVGNGPATLALSPNGAFLHIANWGDRSISVVRAFDQQIVETLALAADPVALIVSGAVTGRLALPMSGASGAMVFAPNGERLYIALSDGATTTLRSLDVASNLLHDAPQSFVGALDRLLLSPAADEQLLDTVNPTASACSTAKNGFYAIDPVTLVPTQIRDLNAGDAVLAAEEGGTRLVLNSAARNLQRCSADTREIYASVALPAALLANGSVINPALRAALRPTVTALDFGKTNVGSANTKTLSLVNDGALPVGITALRFLPLALYLSAAVAADNFSVSTDRCSGRALLPAESCELGVSHRPVTASSAQTVLQVIANPASASSSVNIIGTGVAAGPATARPAAPNSAEATIAGGGAFAPYLLLMALILRGRRQHR